MKVIFPAIWIGAFTFASAALFVAPELLRPSSGGPFDPYLKWIVPVVTIASAGFFWRALVPLKRVRMDAKVLYISNYSTEIAVPLTNVANVSENRRVEPHQVVIDFHTQTAFGLRITFMPKTRWFDSWSPHPVIEEVRCAVNRAMGSPFRELRPN
jgi:hypothetical protein